MSLDVSPALLEQAERGEVDEQEFVDCVRVAVEKGETGTLRSLICDLHESDLGSVIDMEAIRSSGVKIGIDPLGGAAVHY